MRVAGNVVNGAGVTVKGRIEYAVAELNVPLVVVLGHGSCGAVKADMKHLDAKDSLLGSINGLVELIKPPVVQSEGAPGDALENAIRKNSNSVSSGSRIFSPSSHHGSRTANSR
ncbi:MAG TPA: carbonic anhydrase [Terriglobales bacterium]|nr:carbonic anhydrase [Terriglobales bacterium]